jgi:hypothetical protein
MNEADIPVSFKIISPVIGAQCGSIKGLTCSFNHPCDLSHMTMKQHPAPLTMSTAYHDALLAGTAASSRCAYTRDIRYFWACAKLRMHQDPYYPVASDLCLQFVLDHTGTCPLTSTPNYALPVCAQKWAHYA